MRKKTKEIGMTVAAIAVAALSSAVLSCVPSAAAAQQANEPAIDGDDIGGGASVSLPRASIFQPSLQRSLSPTNKAVTSFPTCRPLITAFGCAATAWSTRQRCE